MGEYEMEEIDKFIIKVGSSAGNGEGSLQIRFKQQTTRMLGISYDMDLEATIVIDKGVKKLVITPVN